MRLEVALGCTAPLDDNGRPSKAATNFLIMLDEDLQALNKKLMRTSEKHGTETGAYSLQDVTRPLVTR